MSVIPQFQAAGPRPSNLDRCSRCGIPRSAHGIDWACPQAVAVSSRRLVLLVVVAALLALAGIAVLTVTSTTQASLGTLGASGCLAGLTLLVCGAALAGRRQ